MRCEVRVRIDGSLSGWSCKFWSCLAKIVVKFHQAICSISLLMPTSLNGCELAGELAMAMQILDLALYYCG